jgi:hypothetical protein
MFMGTTAPGKQLNLFKEEQKDSRQPPGAGYDPTQLFEKQRPRLDHNASGFLDGPVAQVQGAAAFDQNVLTGQIQSPPWIFTEASLPMIRA